jgi:uncharacterized protein (DUF2344 family)
MGIVEATTKKGAHKKIKRQQKTFNKLILKPSERERERVAERCPKK